MSEEFKAILELVGQAGEGGYTLALIWIGQSVLIRLSVVAMVLFIVIQIAKLIKRYMDMERERDYSRSVLDRLFSIKGLSSTSYSRLHSDMRAIDSFLSELEANAAREGEG